MSKTLRMCFKKFISGLVAYIESRGGVKLITVDGAFDDLSVQRTPRYSLQT